MKRQKIEGVLFDLDGTLVNSEYGYYLSWLEAFKKENIKIDSKEVQSWSGLSADETAKYIAKKTGNSEIVPLLRRHRAEYFDEMLNQGKIKTKEGAFKLLSFLQKNKKKAVLATSTYSDRAQPILDYLSLNPYLNDKVFGNEVKYLKPHPDIYLKASEKINSDPKSLIAIEDSVSGIKAANAAGIPVIYIPDSSFPNRPKINNLNILYEMSSLNEVHDWLENKI
ncbi:HAD family hydrolase [Aerococcus agrisoli]|uniref:HAD family hydrolase n=1 Tax=Aerococcus agrisoli TaxID=2487350 RepID=UPI0013156B91|nr:HAD family phosphatase [Aerococcus agrisoli]